MQALGLTDNSVRKIMYGCQHQPQASKCMPRTCAPIQASMPCNHDNHTHWGKWQTRKEIHYLIDCERERYVRCVFSPRLAVDQNLRICLRWEGVSHIWQPASCVSESKGLDGRGPGSLLWKALPEWGQSGAWQIKGKLSAWSGLETEQIWQPGFPIQPSVATGEKGNGY